MSEGPKKMAIIASKGSLDDAYPPLILGSTAAALDFEVQIFFTFYGLYILDKKKMKKLQFTPIGKPTLPMPMPNMIRSIPGVTAMATGMMKSWMKGAGVASVSDLIEACLEADVKFIACQMTMDVLKIKRSDLIDECDVGGAATFLEFAKDADITMYM
ncbi:MAG: DsrE/DsrF/DrsH-like family protein [Candidatus Heimdallarchaeota archaeon]|nr:DsrE/DsrF/DrsH-like family protein [Candidatus Heimdallarchaeota archaeon]